jgi:hypothetical protein
MVPIQPNRPSKSYRTGLALIAITAVLCALALANQEAIRGRIWAARLASADSVGERARCLTQICRTGDSARWAVHALATHADSEVRQYAALALQAIRSDWTLDRLRELTADPDENVRRLATSALELRTGTVNSQLDPDVAVEPSTTAPAR